MEFIGVNSMSYEGYVIIGFLSNLVAGQDVSFCKLSVTRNDMDCF